MSNVKTYAVIDSETNLVKNAVLWDGKSSWSPPSGTYTQPLDGTEAGIGWKFEAGNFIDVRDVMTEDNT
jgi:hypothetical protein